MATLILLGKHGAHTDQWGNVQPAFASLQRCVMLCHVMAQRRVAASMTSLAAAQAGSSTLQQYPEIMVPFLLQVRLHAFVRVQALLTSKVRATSCHTGPAESLQDCSMQHALCSMQQDDSAMPCADTGAPHRLPPRRAAGDGGGPADAGHIPAHAAVCL